jgi:hypothetical protein
VAPRAGLFRLGCEVGLGVGLVQGEAALPHTWDELPCQPRLALEACSPSSHVPVHAYFSSHPFLGEWQEVAVVAVYGWWLWMHTRPFLWIALAVAGVTTASR